MPVDAGKVSDEEFKNILEEPGEEQKCISEPQERTPLLTSGDEGKVLCKGYIAGKV